MRAAFGSELASTFLSYFPHNSAAIAPTTAQAKIISTPCGQILILFIKAS
jgi:hypothetical protein